MSVGGIKWFAQIQFNRGQVELCAISDGDRMYVGQPLRLTMSVHDRGDPIAEPTLALSNSEARSLLQALWDIGLRPAENTDRSGEVTALKSHIQFAERMAMALVPGGVK